MNKNEHFLKLSDMIIKKCWSESFSIRNSKGRAPASELVLLRGGLPSEIASRGGSLESKIVYQGVGADFE